MDDSQQGGELGNNLVPDDGTEVTDKDNVLLVAGDAGNIIWRVVRDRIAR